MRFMIMHKTSAHWEAGAVPTPELIARVESLLGAMASAGMLLGAEGLRASSQGVRLNCSGGRRTLTGGPFQGSNELPAGFTILGVATIDEAVEWASRVARVFGDLEIDIRPVTEPWDIGMVPEPEGLTTRRFMALRKATAASEAGVPLTPEQRAELARLTKEMIRAGVHLATAALQPSSQGKRYQASGGKSMVTDGPFTESKELIAGYVMFQARSWEDASEWALRYVAAVGCEEADLRLVAETS